MKRKSPDDPERGEVDLKRNDRSLYSHASRQTSHDGSDQGTSPAYSTATPNYEKPQTPLKKKKHNFTGVSKLAKYKLESKLGEGTFGEVHKGTNKETGEIVALKRILMHHEKEGIPITAVREIKILKQLNHPNVVPLTDMAIFRKKDESGRREQTEVYMVFPYMDHDLAGLLENPSANLSLSHIKTYFQQLLKGTAYLHHNKILHRDIKAANLLIDNKGILQIADFGLARGIEEDGRDYTACVVTRWYRPPELLLGERKYTSAIDMWGVGCILGEILKGRPILQGTDDMDQLKRIFSLVGSPTEETMPGWKDLPDANKVHFDHYKGRMHIDFDDCDPLAVDLLSKILVLDPKKRLTAMDALDHDFFFTEPAPARPEDLPRYSASHEFDNRQRYANAKAAQAHR